MYHTKIRYITITILVLFMFNLVACGGGEKKPVASTGPSGDELVKKMNEVIKTAKSTSFTAEFQVGSISGPVKGTLKAWGERPGKMRAEIQSDNVNINGFMAVADGQKGWAYNPMEKLVVVGEKSKYKTQLRDMPELREIVDFGEKIIDRGFDNTKSVNQGAEKVNNADTYKVKVEYDKSSDPKLDLTGVTATFWVDQKTYFPQRIEVNVSREGLTVGGWAALKGELTIDKPIEATQFMFEPPAGATVIDLSQLPTLPGFKNLPKID